MQSDSFLSDMGPRSAADSDRPSILSVQPATWLPLELRGLSDAELIAATGALRRGIIGWAWAIVPAVTIVVAVTLGLKVALLACLVAIVVCKIGLHLHERSRAVVKGQLAKREFCARYHIGSLTLDEAAAVQQLLEDESTDLIMLFRAWALPHGGHRFIRIALGHKSRIAMFATPFLSDLLRQPSARSRMMKLDLSLSPAHEAQLRAACTKLAIRERDVQGGSGGQGGQGGQEGTRENASPRALAGAPLDGLPCDLVVFRRDAETLRLSMDFRGIASLHELSSAERLVADVLEIESAIMGMQRFEVELPSNRDRIDLIARSI
jgi:hypothetical protein